MEGQKFSIGEIVYETVRPGQKLVITKVKGKIYHCKLHEYMNRKAIIYPERDLKAERKS